MGHHPGQTHTATPTDSGLARHPRVKTHYQSRMGAQAAHNAAGGTRCLEHVRTNKWLAMSYLVATGVDVATFPDSFPEGILDVIQSMNGVTDEEKTSSFQVFFHSTALENYVGECFDIIADTDKLGNVRPGSVKDPISWRLG